MPKGIITRHIILEYMTILLLLLLIRWRTFTCVVGTKTNTMRMPGLLF